MVRAALEVRLKTSGCTKSRIPAPNRLVRARATSEVTNHSSKMPRWQVRFALAARHSHRLSASR